MAAAPIHVSVSGRTDVGRTRDHNEDTFLVADLGTGQVTLEPGLREQVVGERGMLLMVADGMGGAAAGELASAMAAESIHAHLAATWSKEGEADAQRFAFRMREAVEEANARIHGYALEHTDVRGMGTTVTAAGVYGPDLYIAQIGDSRAYLIRQGRASLLTKDQSLTQRLVDAGELTEEEAERSERRNIILQALGPDPQIRVDLTHEPLRRGDVLVLCSDGLSNQVKREDLAAQAAATPDLDALVEALVALANERGGPDNITVVVARFDGPGLPLDEIAEAPGHHVFALPGDAPLEEDFRTGYSTGEIRPADRVGLQYPPAQAPASPAPAAAPDTAPVRPRLPVALLSSLIIGAAILLYFLLTR